MENGHQPKALSKTRLNWKEVEKTLAVLRPGQIMDYNLPRQLIHNFMTKHRQRLNKRYLARSEHGTQKLYVWVDPDYRE